MTQFAMGGGMHEYTVDAIQKALFTPSIGQVHEAPEWSDADLDWADRENLHKSRPLYPSKGWHWHNPPDKAIRGKLLGRLPRSARLAPLCAPLFAQLR